MASDAELLMELFRGSDLTHGRSDMTREVTAKGKHETRSWLEKKPVTLVEWEKHIQGLAGIGMPPLNSENKVLWGAIDVDTYDGTTLESVNKRIHEFNLPLVVCRSKSGGPHIFLFVHDWVPAKVMVEKLDNLAGFMGFGTSEIFPKQVSISTDGPAPDYGSWINMPYFGGTKFLRYGIDGSGNALATIPDFVSYARSRALSVEDLSRYQTPQVSEEVFPEGPPCLNTIMAGRPSDLRNIILSNAAVYCRKAYGENWQSKLDEINAKFGSPLGSSEVEGIKKSYAKKEYRYQCSKQPLCNFCESSKCKKLKYGIGTQDFLPATRSLTMVDTNPPIWYLDITMPDGKDIRISLSTEQLQNPRLFQRRAMETTQKMPPSMSIEAWEPVVQGLMAHCRVENVPPEATPQGQFIELVHEFLANRAKADSMEDLLRGNPYKDAQSYYFRLKDLWLWVQQKKFTLLKNHEMVSILVSKQLGGTKAFRQIKGVGVNMMMIPVPKENTPEALEPAKFQAPY